MAKKQTPITYTHTHYCYVSLRERGSHGVGSIKVKINRTEEQTSRNNESFEAPCVVELKAVTELGRCNPQKPKEVRASLSLAEEST